MAVQVTRYTITAMLLFTASNTFTQLNIIGGHEQRTPLNVQVIVEPIHEHVLKFN